MVTVAIAVILGSDSTTAGIRKSNCSTPIVVDVLGVETNNDGKIDKIYIRSNIHSMNDKTVAYEGWEPTGAISTILDSLERLGVLYGAAQRYINCYSE